MLRTMGFPGQYLQGPKALHELGSLLSKMGFKKPLFLCDTIVAEKVWPLASGSMKAVRVKGSALSICDRLRHRRGRWPDGHRARAGSNEIDQDYGGLRK